MKRYAKTLDELAELSGISKRSIVYYKRNSKFPPKRKAGWNVEHVILFIRAEQAKSESEAKAAGGTINELRAQKLRIEIDVADLGLQQLRGEMITVEDHIAAFREYAMLVNEGYDQWISMVSAITHDAELVKKAKEIRDRVRSFLASKLKEGPTDED